MLDAYSKRLSRFALALSALVPLIGVGSGLAAEPYRPSDDAVVLLTVPASDHPDEVALMRLRAARDRAPESVEAATAFARKAIEIGRQRGEPRYMGYAEAALAPWRGDGAPVAVRVLRATLAQHRHAFDEALHMLDAVLVAEPANAQARLTRAVIHTVQGRPREALRDCAGLLGRVSPLVLATCTASASRLMPASATARQLLATELSRAATAPSTERLWALTVRAELAEQRGDPETEAAFRAAMTEASASAPDPYLLYAYADFLLAAGRVRDAHALLAPHAGLDGAELRLAIAERRWPTADARVAEALARRIERIQAGVDEVRLRGEAPHLRELARFQLDVMADPDAALAVAQDNWRTQREPSDALLLLRAADAAGQPAAAQSVRDWMATTGIEDLRLQAAVARLARQ